MVFANKTIKRPRRHPRGTASIHQPIRISPMNYRNSIKTAGCIAMLGLLGACLIVVDNFLIDEHFQFKNILSFSGNVMLVIASILAAKDNSKKRT